MPRDLNKQKVFLSFGKLLHLIATSKMSKREIRDWLVKNCETDDIILLVDVLNDLLEETKR